MSTEVAGVEVVAAPGEGDDAIVSVATEFRDRGHDVIVVTSDRGLSERIVEVGGRVRGARWLRDLLDVD